MVLLWLILFSLVPNILCDKSRNASITWSEKYGKYTILDYIAKDSVAYGTFLDEVNVTGWSYLEVVSNEKYPDPVQAYAAGLVEGYLTADLINKHWYNIADGYCNGEEPYCERLVSFLKKNIDYLNSNIQSSRRYDSYWHQVALTLEQLNGIEDGSKNITSTPSTHVNIKGLLFLNLLGDLMDLETILKKNDQQFKNTGHCSGLIKVLPNNKDLYIAQDTWNTYGSMLRVLKKYSLKFHITMREGSLVIPGHTATFSSYPGCLYSGDDFYIISSGLVAIETTINNHNVSLWKYVTPDKIVFEWQRNLLANRLAENGRQWTNFFSILNSGTYNNQWMVLDYNKFIPGKPLQDDLLWVLEQLPGYLHSEDMTDTLRKQSYWPSYNIAYFPDIFNLSGEQDAVKKYGDFDTYDKNPRALIFKRDHIKVHDLLSMIKLMRYNDYTKDPLARCNCTPPYSAESGISARCDLNPKNGTYPFAALGHRQIGGTDMKLTTSTMYKNLEFVAYGGPTYDSLPPFQWSKSDFDKTVRHVGQPDLWMFKPIVRKWVL